MHRRKTGTPSVSDHVISRLDGQLVSRGLIEVESATACVNPRRLARRLNDRPSGRTNPDLAPGGCPVRQASVVAARVILAARRIAGTPAPRPPIVPVWMPLSGCQIP